MTTSDYILRTSLDYSLYVCDNRSIPYICDGLKNSQRIALWLLRNRAEKIKTLALSGLMSYERLYVHGDVSANNAISLLAAPYRNNIPLIEGLGQFGSRTAPVEGIGAPRYTEVKRTKAAEAFLYTDLNLVPLQENYDGSNMQPIHFLPIIPNILLNGVKGVAVGWATDIQPRSLKSIIAAVQACIRGKPVKGLDPYYEKYDIKVDEIAPGSWIFTGKINRVDTSSVRVVELPPGIAIEAFRKNLDKLEEKDAITGYVDRSSDKIDILVKFKRGSIKDVTDESIIDLLKLKEKVSENIVVRDWDGNSIKQFSNPVDLVKEFTEWRLGWYTKRFEKMKEDLTFELPYWQALKILIQKQFPKKLGTFVNRAEMIDAIVSILASGKMVLHESHIDRIVNLPTYRWTKELETTVDEKIASILNEISDIEAVLSSPDMLKEVYYNELEDLKKMKL